MIVYVCQIISVSIAVVCIGSRCSRCTFNLIVVNNPKCFILYCCTVQESSEHQGCENDPVGEGLQSL